MNLRQDGISVPVSGCDFVSSDLGDLILTEPGGKCIHGNYIPSNQADQALSMNCDLCVNLRQFCEFYGLTTEEADARLRRIWSRLKENKEEKGNG